MTPQEALVAAIQDAKERPPRWGDDLRPYAAAILDALPRGYDLTSQEYREGLVQAGAQQERERLRPVLEAAQALYDCAADDDVCIRDNTRAIIGAVAACGGSFLADPDEADR